MVREISSFCSAICLNLAEGEREANLGLKVRIGRLNLVGIMGVLGFSSSLNSFFLDVETERTFSALCS